MQIAPYATYEEDRIAALHSYDILDTETDQDLDDLAILASEICQTPVGMVTLIDGDRQWIKAATGVNDIVISREKSFCTHTIAARQEILIVPDARKDARFADNPFVTGDTNVVFYAGVPLVNEDGFALGALCVIDTQTKILSDRQIKALKVLAKQVIDKIEYRRKVDLLNRVVKELETANLFTQKFAKMAAHDIKNPLSSVLLTAQALKIRLEKINEESSLKLIDLNIYSIRRLTNLLDEMLAYSASPALLLAKKQPVLLSDALNSVLSLLVIPENIDITLPNKNYLLNISVVAFEQIFINLLSNAIRYNDKDTGKITIRFAQDDDCYLFEVEDNGIGINEKYHADIFNNNFTLKITDRYNKKGTGIGLSTVKDLIELLGGTISLTSQPQLGTTFSIKISK